MRPVCPPPLLLRLVDLDVSDRQGIDVQPLQLHIAPRKRWSCAR